MPSRRSTPPRSQAVNDDWVAIIDDHAPLRTSLTRALRLEGIRAEMFASAEEFLERPSPTPPRCLILDMQLPGIGGHELAHVLERHWPPRPPIIFITGHDDLLASLSGCCVAHGGLCKPFKIDALLALVTPLVRTDT